MPENALSIEKSGLSVNLLERLERDITRFRQLAENEKIDIFAINETKIDDKVKDQLVDIDEFDLKRSDRDCVKNENFRFPS